MSAFVAPGPQQRPRPHVLHGIVAGLAAVAITVIAIYLGMRMHQHSWWPLSLVALTACTYSPCRQTWARRWLVGFATYAVICVVTVVVLFAIAVVLFASYSGGGFG